MKALNIFGIILAWILSIAMVLMLIAAPLALSALSLLDPENIAELVGDALVGADKSAAAKPQKEYSIENLSVNSSAREENALAVSPIDESIPADDILGGMMDSIQDIIGEELDGEVLSKIMSSDLAEDLLDAYVSDVTNAVTGKPGENRFTAETIVVIVEENVDEIIELVEEAGGEMNEEQKEQLKGEIQQTVEENAQEIAQEIVNAVPAPKEFIESNEIVKVFAALMAKKNQIKGMIVGAIMAISLLIFALRYPGFRGLRWLSANLFTAGGFNIVSCLVLGVGSTAVKGFVTGMNAIRGTAVDGIIGTLLSQLTTGVIIRTVVILVAAIALLVAYILLKIFVRKKKAKKAEPPEAEPVFEPAPAPLPKAAPAAPVYTSVTIEPELMTEPAPEMAGEPAEAAEETAEDVIAEGPVQEEI